MNLLQLLEAITEKPSEEAVKSALVAWQQKNAAKIKEAIEGQRKANRNEWYSWECKERKIKTLRSLPDLKVGNLSLKVASGALQSSLVLLDFKTESTSGSNYVDIAVKLHANGTLVSAEVALQRRKGFDRSVHVWHKEYHDRSEAGYDIKKSKIDVNDDVKKFTKLLSVGDEHLFHFGQVMVTERPDSPIHVLARIPAKQYKDKLEPVIMKFNLKWLRAIILGDSEDSPTHDRGTGLKRWMDWCSHHGYRYEGYKSIIESLRKLAVAHLEKDYSKELNHNGLPSYEEEDEDEE